MTDEEIIKAYKKLFRKMPPDMGAEEIVHILMLQRKKYKGRRQLYNKDKCVLIDLKTGVIAGSGICPHCHGWIGRTEYNED